jgi:hypothetical protein
MGSHQKRDSSRLLVRYRALGREGFDDGGARGLFEISRTDMRDSRRDGEGLVFARILVLVDARMHPPKKKIQEQIKLFQEQMTKKGCFVRNAYHCSAHASNARKRGIFH